MKCAVSKLCWNAKKKNSFEVCYFVKSRFEVCWKLKYTTWQNVHCSSMEPSIYVFLVSPNLGLLSWMMTKIQRSQKSSIGSPIRWFICYRNIVNPTLQNISLQFVVDSSKKFFKFLRSCFFWCIAYIFSSFLKNLQKELLIYIIVS